MNNHPIITGAVFGVLLTVMLWFGVFYCAVNYDRIREFIVSAVVPLVAISGGITVLLWVIAASFR